MKRRNLFTVSIALAVMLVSFGVISKGGQSETKEPAESTNEPKNSYAIFSVELPDYLEFAGEVVPVDQIDILESLDREVLVNTYWQSQTLLFIKRANRFFPTIEKILKEKGVPDDFKYLAVAESGLTHAVSPSNAVGFWQLLEGTAKDYGLEVNDEIDERYHIEKATGAAADYLLDSYEKYGSWTMTAASYNAGRRGMDRQIARQKDKDYYDLLLNEETARYMYRILAYKLILTNPPKYGFHVGENALYPEIPYYEVTVDGRIPDFTDFAARYGINYKILKWMNPWLRESFLTNSANRSYYLKIPRKGFFNPDRVDEESREPLLTSTKN